MKTMMRLLLVLVLTPSPGLKSGGVSQSSQEDSQTVSDGLEVRIEPLKSVITSGETLQLRVEIRNIGKRDDIFICKDFQGPNQACGNLRLNFDPASGGPRMGLAYDYAFSNKNASRTAFVNVLVRNWISIPPGHFYGTIIEIDPFSYGIGKPGRYHIYGEYHSGGLLAPVEYNNLLAYPDEVSQLPGKSWQGRVDTNSVQVRVIPKK